MGHHKATERKGGLYTHSTEKLPRYHKISQNQRIPTPQIIYECNRKLVDYQKDLEENWQKQSDV